MRLTACCDPRDRVLQLFSFQRKLSTLSLSLSMKTMNWGRDPQRPRRAARAETGVELARVRRECYFQPRYLQTLSGMTAVDLCGGER